MISIFKWLPLLLSLISSSFATQQEILGSNEGSPFDSHFEKLVNETLDMWHVPGLSIAVVDGDSMWAEVSLSSCCRSPGQIVLES